MTWHSSFNREVWLGLTLSILLILPGFVRAEREAETAMAGAPLEFELTLVAPPVNPVVLSLDRVGLAELINEADRRAMVLMNLTRNAAVTSALVSIRSACGPGWWDQDFVPSCPVSWTTEDMHMWQVLTLTPLNAPFECTSYKGLIEIAETLAGLGLVDDASELLSTMLNITPATQILSTANLVIALKKDLLATHPAVNSDATLPISLQDALTDLSELPARFGPQAGHAGVLDDSDTTSALLSDAFEVTLESTDNRLFYEGFDLCYSKNTIALAQGGSVTDFDFETLDVEGLVPNPSVDLSLKITESHNFIEAFTDSNSRNAPELPPNGPGEVWQLSPWLLEYTLIVYLCRSAENVASFLRIASKGKRSRNNWDQSKNCNMKIFFTLTRIVCFSVVCSSA